MNWLALEMSPPLIAIWSNGTTVFTRAKPVTRFISKVLGGNCSAMDVRTVNRSRRLVHRADRVAAWLRCAINGNVLLFSSSHFLRVLTARWLGQEVSVGRFFLLDTTSLSILGYEHVLQKPVVRLWNDSRRHETFKEHHEFESQ